MNPGRPPLDALTGVRFLAAMYVVWFHYAPADMPRLLRNAVLNGHLAVGLFFVLSGFVLAYNYAGRKVAPRKFWLARFARIYPAYLLGFVLIAPAVIVRLQHDPFKLAASGLAAGTLLQGWIPGLALMWNGPGWSLSNEAFFYLLFPAVLPWLQSLSRRSLWTVAAACCMAAACAGESVQYVPLFRLPEFVLGVATGLLYLDRRAGGWLWQSAAAVGLFLLLPPDSLPAGIRNAIAAPLFAVLVYALASSEGILTSRPMRKLGDASYAIYILQSPVMAYFLLATQGMSAGGTRSPLTWMQFTLYCAILTGVSIACFEWWETPARRWILGAGAPKKEVVPSDPISSPACNRHARYEACIDEPRASRPFAPQ